MYYILWDSFESEWDANNDQIVKRETSIDQINLRQLILATQNKNDSWIRHLLKPEQILKTLCNNVIWQHLLEDRSEAENLIGYSLVN